MNGPEHTVAAEAVGIAATAAAELPIERTCMASCNLRVVIAYNNRPYKQFSGNSDKVSTCV